MEPYLIALLTLMVGGLGILAFNRPRIYQKMWLPFFAAIGLIQIILTTWSLAVTTTQSRMGSISIDKARSVAEIQLQSAFIEKMYAATESLQPNYVVIWVLFTGAGLYLFFLNWLAHHVINDSN